MGHNHVVSGNSKSTGSSQVVELPTGPPDFGCHNVVLELRYKITCSVIGMGLGYGVAV